MLDSFCQKYNLLKIFLQVLLILIKTTDSQEDQTIIKDFVICKNCGADASITNFFIYKLSPFAEFARNETVFNTENILVQDVRLVSFKFPSKIVILKRAYCAKVDVWLTEYSFFPGYAFKLCLCPKCALHLGWMFEPIDTATEIQDFPSASGFYALLLNNLISEHFVNNLLAKENIFN